MGSALDERRRRRANISSMVFFIIAGLLIVAGILYYIRDQRSGSTLPPPTSLPGHYTSIDVVQALKQAGIKNVAYEKRSVQSPVLSPPAQPLKVDGAVLYLFIYETPAAREQQSANLNPTAALPQGELTSGAPPPTVIAGSNVLAVLVGGDSQLQTKIESVIKGLT